MSTPPDDPRKLTPTRIFLIAFVAVALGLAAMTIIASLDAWRQNDLADAAPEAQ